MKQKNNVHFFLLNFLAIFPHGKTAVYDLRSEIKAEFTEVGTFASQYFIDGKLHITHDTDNKNFKRAFIVTLQDANTSLKNGNKTTEGLSIPAATSDALNLLQEPFGLIFKESGEVTIVLLNLFNNLSYKYNYNM